MTEQTLLLDADDTLWENNIYFLEVTEHFISAVGRSEVQREIAHQVLLQTERKNIPIHGYGSRAFAMSIVEAFHQLVPDHDPDIVASLHAAAEAIFRREHLELRPGIVETLPLLARTHRLVLLTKGDAEEQAWKLERSGLRQHFHWVEVVDEKNVETYLTLIRRLQLDPTQTWMIGNSPRSDINPALKAGLNAILIPHPQTWELELEEITETGTRFRTASSITEVATWFLEADSTRTGDKQTYPPFLV